MTWLLVVVMCVLGFVVVGVVGLPARRTVSGRVTIATGPAAIYPLIANLESGWSRWSQLGDAGLDSRYSGPSEGEGASQTWTGKAGRGWIEIVRSDAARGISYRMELGRLAATGSFEMRQDGDSTSVTWTDHVDLGSNPLVRWLGLAMDGMRRKNISRDLARLKRIAESAPPESRQ